MNKSIGDKFYSKYRIKPLGTIWRAMCGMWWVMSMMFLFSVGFLEIWAEKPFDTAPFFALWGLLATPFIVAYIKRGRNPFPEKGFIMPILGIFFAIIVIASFNHIQNSPLYAPTSVKESFSITTEKGITPAFSDEYLEALQVQYDEWHRMTYFYVVPAMLLPILWFSTVLIVRIKRYRTKKVRILNTNSTLTPK